MCQLQFKLSHGNHSALIPMQQTKNLSVQQKTLITKEGIFQYKIHKFKYHRISQFLQTHVN
jgi:hypothetical protein